VAQVALSLVLLVGGLLFGRSLFNLVTVDSGFQQDSILEADVDLNTLDLTSEARRAVRAQLLDRIRATPGVDAAAMTSVVPLVGTWYGMVFVDGVDRESRSANFNRVSAGYFDTLGTTLLSGRDFDDRDSPHAPNVAIVNDTFARRYLAGRAVIGTTFHIGGEADRPGPATQIVGLVRDTKYENIREDFRPIVYLPESQTDRPEAFAQMVIRSRAPMADLRSAVKRSIEDVSPNASFHFHDFQEQSRYGLRRDRLLATLCGFFAALGGVLATLGVYGVISYNVVQRTNEIGIRLALGARRAPILGLILREALVLVAAGLGIGEWTYTHFLGLKHNRSRK